MSHLCPLPWAWTPAPFLSKSFIHAFVHLTLTLPLPIHSRSLLYSLRKHILSVSCMPGTSAVFFPVGCQGNESLSGRVEVGHCGGMRHPLAGQRMETTCGLGVLPGWMFFIPNTSWCLPEDTSHLRLSFPSVEWAIGVLGTWATAKILPVVTLAVQSFCKLTSSASMSQVESGNRDPKA